jgi:DNA repair protein RadA
MTTDVLHYDEENYTAKEETKANMITLSDIPGVGAATAEKLMEGGFDTVVSIAVATPGQIVEAAGIGEAAARKMIKFCRSAMQMGFESGEDALEKRSSIIKISTGCDSFDKLLGGGFETGAILECFGEFGSSKTQIAHVLCVQNYKRDPTSISVYIDTERTFRPERIIELSEAQGLDPQNVLRSIKVAKAYNSDHQMLLAEKVDDLVNKDGLNVKLVIVDSLMAHFRSEFMGRGSLAERQQKICKLMHTLSRISDVHNLCVYVTNQVMSKPDQFFGDPTTPIGGHIVGHASTFRMYLRKGKKGSRVVKLIDAPNLADGETCFFVTKEGLVEAN